LASPPAKRLPTTAEAGLMLDAAMTQRAKNISGGIKAITGLVTLHILYLYVPVPVDLYFAKPQRQIFEPGVTKGLTLTATLGSEGAPAASSIGYRRAALRPSLTLSNVHDHSIRLGACCVQLSSPEQTCTHKQLR
jgi:hypothetical protein